ncbi:DUF1636 family protein [Oceanicella actignis]|uniref:Predicted metal-binding protein n=1 Tax=Oceanicella actignis TaxID=1189325 RepID=A0A1M7THK4_9RHOB|nr:DUF1636 domain-containing protein [Oceanicella actignis]SET58570.1 Predicted metal-binding protein [Oceanicella actignis]SHN70259.1 Predicted metal-binding protein [Oceanicella actignis]
MSVRLIICETCAHAPGEKLRDGRTGGEALLAEVERAARDAPGVAVERHACLMGCEHPCNAAIAAEGKIGYVLGRFAPTADSARALVEYAALYADSPTGQVPYRQWPQGVKGHFIARIPAPRADTAKE